jgi:hypothetical protein
MEIGVLNYPKVMLILEQTNYYIFIKYPKVV